MTALINPVAFFDWIRSNDMLGPVLTNDEVEGLNVITAAASLAGWPIAWTAYALATAYHETAHTMQPIKERGGDDYFRRMYDISERTRTSPCASVTSRSATGSSTRGADTCNSLAAPTTSVRRLNS